MVARRSSQTIDAGLEWGLYQRTHAALKSATSQHLARITAKVVRTFFEEFGQESDASLTDPAGHMMKAKTFRSVVHHTAHRTNLLREGVDVLSGL